LDLSRVDSWKLRSSGLNAVGKLRDLSDAEKDRLLERLAQVLTDPDEIFYVKKDAAYAAGGQELCNLLSLLIDSLDEGHYSIRFSASEAIRALAAAGCNDVAAAMIDRVGDMSPRALVAALHAAHALPIEERLDVADAALGAVTSEEGALAVARLVSAIEPETSDQQRRIDRISRALPETYWTVLSVLGGDE
jgi:HEAT repeat protein